MLSIALDSGPSFTVLLTSNSPLTVSQIWKEMQYLTPISKENFYIIYNGRLVNDSNTLLTGHAIITPRLLGGKGGFGSMLRAIGAQIEKTTNREACRDLSGRRLRDINEEKRLKVWIEKQAQRKEEAAERKKKKLAKLCSEPKHEFKDKNYDQERSVLTERVADAVEEGFKAAVSSSGVKRLSESQPKTFKKKKVSLGYGMDFDSDELDSSDDNSESQIRENSESNEKLPKESNDKVIEKKESSSDNSENVSEDVDNLKAENQNTNDVVSETAGSNDEITNEKSKLVLTDS